jgi:hypothetical protein
MDPGSGGGRGSAMRELLRAERGEEIGERDEK